VCAGTARQEGRAHEALIWPLLEEWRPDALCRAEGEVGAVPREQAHQSRGSLYERVKQAFKGSNWMAGSPEEWKMHSAHAGGRPPPPAAASADGGTDSLAAAGAVAGGAEQPAVAPVPAPPPPWFLKHAPDVAAAGPLGVAVNAQPSQGAQPPPPPPPPEQQEQGEASCSPAPCADGRVNGCGDVGSAGAYQRKILLPGQYPSPAAGAGSSGGNGVDGGGAATSAGGGAGEGEAELTIIASLVEDVAAVGGLARSCEIFAVSAASLPAAVLQPPLPPPPKYFGTEICGRPRRAGMRGRMI
jgi:hypothetical protein